jgi:hypothetical protein
MRRASRPNIAAVEVVVSGTVEREMRESVAEDLKERRAWWAKSAMSVAIFSHMSDMTTRYLKVQIGLVSERFSSCS